MNPSNHPRSPSTPRRARTTAITIAVALACATAQAQTWDYKSYKKSKTGQYNKDDFVVGSISVEQKDGKAFFRMTAGATDVCYRGALPATLTQSDATTVIEVTQPVAGCEAFRYTIHNDGSGGFKEVRYSGAAEWVKSRFDHGLRPMK